MINNIKQQSNRRRSRGIYLLPNLFTTAALFAGFFAVLSAIDGYFDKAAIAIFVAIIFDGLDGRIARMTKTQSPFGAEYDSLSDMVAFGLAPGIIIYLWALQELSRFGWLAAFIYVVGAALRLARFNTTTHLLLNKHWFLGLPSPAAAALIAGSIWVSVKYKIDIDTIRIPVAILTTFSGLAMVSNLCYYNFKDVDWHGKVPFIALVLISFFSALIIAEPPLVLFSIFLGYIISGIICSLRQNKKIIVEEQKKERDNKSKKTITHSLTHNNPPL